MLRRKAKGKSSPINLVTPGDVVSSQQLLRAEQHSLKLFFQRGYNSYTFLGLYAVLTMLIGGSCVWISIKREVYEGKPGFLGLEATISLLAVLEFVYRLGLSSLCSYIREPLHWVDLTLLLLWFTALVPLHKGQVKYHILILSIQAVFLGRIVVLGGWLLRSLRKASKYNVPNINILNISQMPGEVEILAFDESQASQLQLSERQGKDIRVDQHHTYFSPKHTEAGLKLEIDD